MKGKGRRSNVALSTEPLHRISGGCRAHFHVGICYIVPTFSVTASSGNHLPEEVETKNHWAYKALHRDAAAPFGWLGGEPTCCFLYPSQVANHPECLLGFKLLPQADFPTLPFPFSSPRKALGISNCG